MIKTIIVDDDELCISVIEDMIDQLEEFSCVGTFQNALDAYTFINNNQVDVLFLDVEMPKMGGMELLKNLENPPLVVMITSHDEFALESYEYNVTDFLKKPVEWARFIKTVKKINNKLFGLGAKLVEKAKCHLSTPMRWTIIIRQIKMGNTSVKSGQTHISLGFMRSGPAKIVP